MHSLQKLDEHLLKLKMVNKEKKNTNSKFEIRNTEQIRYITLCKDLLRNGRNTSLFLKLKRKGDLKGGYKEHLFWTKTFF